MTRNDEANICTNGDIAAGETTAPLPAHYWASSVQRLLYLCANCLFLFRSVIHENTFAHKKVDLYELSHSKWTDQIQLSELVTAQGFQMARWAKLEVCHRPLASRYAP